MDFKCVLLGNALVFFIPMVLSPIINYYLYKKVKYFFYIGIGIGFLCYIISFLLLLALHDFIVIDYGGICPQVNIGIVLIITFGPMIMIFAIERWLVKRAIKDENGLK
jgi:hypothetical protein